MFSISTNFQQTFNNLSNSSNVDAKSPNQSVTNPTGRNNAQEMKKNTKMNVDDNTRIDEINQAEIIIIIIRPN